MNLTNDQKEYLLREYDKLVANQNFLISQIVTDQRSSIITIGAVWAWLATQSTTVLVEYVKWMPALVVLLFAAKRISLSKSIHSIKEYLLKVEAAFGLEDGLGWERHMASQRSYALRKWDIAFYSSLFAGNIVLAIVTSA